jgi:transcriptional regulator with XRE-family HTH domain
MGVGRPRGVASPEDGRLAATLRAEREREGLTRAQLAARAQMSGNTLMALEQGRTKDPGFFKVAALCRALNVGLDELRIAVGVGPARKVPAMSHGIVSIGYEGRTIDSFVEELLAAGVTTVADVRMTPISRKPGFSKTRLNAALTDAGIAYVHLRSLGNPKSNREPFWNGRAAEGQAVFRELINAEEPTAAIAHLTDLAGEQVVAVLCFENEHANCHRQVVIDEVTRQQPMPVLALR